MTELARAVRRPILLILLLAAGALAAAAAHPARRTGKRTPRPARPRRAPDRLPRCDLPGRPLGQSWPPRAQSPPPRARPDRDSSHRTPSTSAFCGNDRRRGCGPDCLAQTAVFSKKPVAPATRAAASAAAYVISRLRVSMKGKRIRGSGLTAAAAAVGLALVVASAGRLLLIPAVSAGRASVEGGSASGAADTWRGCVLAPRQGGRPRCRSASHRAGGGIRRSWVGHFLWNLPLPATVGRRYRAGSIHPRRRQGTTFAALLESRPDIYGVFSLEYASATPRLAFVRTLVGRGRILLERVAFPVRHGATRSAAASEREGVAKPAAAGKVVELWIRLRWWPWTDLRPGLRIGAPVFDWAVAPSWSTRRRHDLQGLTCGLEDIWSGKSIGVPTR